MTEIRANNGAIVYLVGGGIASLAAAAFLIRDEDIPGHNITSQEALSWRARNAFSRTRGSVLRALRYYLGTVTLTQRSRSLIVLREEAHKAPPALNQRMLSDDMERPQGSGTSPSTAL
jgi:hypothetical protein